MLRIACFLFIACLLTADASAAAIRIVAFGDSFTSGWRVPQDQAYPAQLQKRLRAKGYDVTVKNAGVPGDTAAGALKRFEWAIDPGTDICIVEFGINDIGKKASLTTVRQRLAKIVGLLRARQIEVLVVGLDILDFADIARANDALYVQWKLPRGEYRIRDGWHFSAQGYAILVGKMLPQVEALIERVSGAPD